MGTSTSNIQLYKPDPTDPVNVSTDLNANSDKIDAFAGRVAARPNIQTVYASGDLQVITTTTDIPGASITVVTTEANAIAEVTADFDWDLTANPSSNFNYGLLYVDGTDQNHPAIFNMWSSLCRIPGSKNWLVTLAAAGSHTLKLRARRDVADSAVSYFRSSGTQLKVKLWENPLS